MMLSDKEILKQRQEQALALSREERRPIQDDCDEYWLNAWRCPFCDEAWHTVSPQDRPRFCCHCGEALSGEPVEYPLYLPDWKELQQKRELEDAEGSATVGDGE